MKKVEIKPLDVLFFRDSRPMGGSFKGRGENFPMPHTFNGALRSAIQSDGTDFFTVGPFLKKSDEIYFQTPGDLILNGSNSNNSESSNVMRISPLEGNYYTNLPNGMKPIGSSGIVETKEKLGNFISSSDFEKYLRNESLNPSSFKTNSDFYAIENNFGIAIDKLTNIAVEQKFFTKNTIRLKDNVSFVGLMRDSKDYPEHTYIRFGGEARYSDCRVEDISESILPVPPEITGNRVKFVLLTPAIFVQQQDYPGGWLPNWVNHNDNSVTILDGPGAAKARRMRAKGIKVSEGSPIKAKLVGAKINRAIAVSGIATGNGMRKSCGEKATLMAVPAGSVYYFEAENETEAQKLAKALNWNSGSSNCLEVKNVRSMLLGEKGYGIGACTTWTYSNLE